MATYSFSSGASIPGSSSGASGNALTAAIPGFSGLNTQATDLIRSLMSGQLSPQSRRAIYDAGAERATASGMPGSTGMANSLFANADLRNIGRASADQQQQGFQDLLALIQGYSGTVAPSAGQEQQNQQFNQQLAFNKDQAAVTNQLNQDQFGLQQQEYMQRYGPKKYSRSMISRGGANIVPGGFKPYEFFA